MCESPVSNSDLYDQRISRSVNCRRAPRMATAQSVLALRNPGDGGGFGGKRFGENAFAVIVDDIESCDVDTIVGRLEV
jgi:hypothetical protein